MIGIEGGRINIVPVDFVADALDYLAHKKGLDGQCFHLTDPEPHRIGEVLNIFARAGHAPQMTMRINAKMFGFIPAPILYGLGSLAPVKRAIRVVLTDLGIPRDVFQFVNWPTRYDNREAAKALKGSGIEVPRLETYAAKLWDYWERNLDPDLFIDRSLAGRVKDKVVVVTGSSSGIGKATALELADAGAKVILVARGEEKLLETKAEIEHAGGKALDLPGGHRRHRVVRRARAARPQGARRAATYLVNNAGRSIRRGVINSFDRFHDFERTMQLNYFGALRLIMGFLPKMIEKKRGHIINISSIGVLSNAPRFSAYVASKAALDSFSACAASEFLDKGIYFTTINMPLVRTPMIAPTKIYESVPTLSPEEAADLVVRPSCTGPCGSPRASASSAPSRMRSRPSSRRCCSTRRSTCSPIRAPRQGKKGGGAAAAHGRADGVRPDHAGDSLVAARVGSRRARARRRGFDARRPRAPPLGRSRLSLHALQFRRDEREDAAVRDERVVADAGERDVLGAVELARSSAARPSSRAMTTATRPARRREPLRPRLSSASHALPGRSCAERRPGKEPRVDAAVVRRAERHHRAHLRGAVPAQVRPGHEAAHAVADERDARRAGGREDRIDLRRDLVDEELDRFERRAVAHRVDRTDVARDEVRARGRAWSPRCKARRGAAGPARGPARAAGRPCRSDRAPCCGPDRPIARISSQKRRSARGEPDAHFPRALRAEHPREREPQRT